MAVVKQGALGAMIRSAEGIVYVPAVEVDTVIDTTGAGDFWAAGFLYGLLNDCPLDACGHMGAFLGAQAVRHVGADLPAAAWGTAVDYFNPYLLKGKEIHETSDCRRHAG
jgi:sugar/nucleoside kinase (ribokinase family)